MSLGIGSKTAQSVHVIHLNGLENVDITDADVRTGKISIDSNGNRIVGAATQRFLERSTADATAIASDIANGKTLWVNGNLVTGTYISLTPALAIRGIDYPYTVATGNTIAAGDFVKLTNSYVAKVTSSSDKIIGIAVTAGSAGASITVRVPY